MNLSNILGFMNKVIIKGEKTFLDDIKSNFSIFSTKIENKKH